MQILLHVNLHLYTKYVSFVISNVSLLLFRFIKRLSPKYFPDYFQTFTLLTSRPRTQVLLFYGPDLQDDGKQPEEGDIRPRHFRLGPL